MPQVSLRIGKVNSKVDKDQELHLQLAHSFNKQTFRAACCILGTDPSPLGQFSGWMGPQQDTTWRGQAVMEKHSGLPRLHGQPGEEAPEPGAREDRLGQPCEGGARAPL